MELFPFAIAMLLGALVGLQREYEQKHSHLVFFAGIRTFMFISLLGALVGFISIEVFHSQIFALIGFIGIFVFAALSYIFGYIRYKRNTATTEITSILVFIVGLLCILSSIKLAVMVGIVTAALLTFKKRIHGVAENMKSKELAAIMGFALIALVFLPLLPNKNYTPLDIPFFGDLLISLGISASILLALNVFNPYSMWIMVILVTGISLLGYILVKFFGTRKGYWLTGLFGGIASSTAVTLAMSTESKKNPTITKPFVTAVIVATAVSFVRIMFIVVAINKSLVSAIIVPLGLMAITGITIAAAMYSKHNNRKPESTLEVTQPFALIPALKFGLLFVAIKFLAKFLQISFGSTGVYVAGILGGLGDVDAITLTMASLSNLGDISPSLAVSAIVLAAVSNTIVKIGLAWSIGHKRFATYLSIALGIILLLGISAVFI